MLTKWSYSGGGDESWSGYCIPYPMESLYITKDLLYSSAIVSNEDCIKDEAAIHAAMLQLGYGRDDYR